MEDVFKVEKVRFCEIFCKGISFKIPPYQRPYAWEDKQIDDLRNDFINAKNSGYPEYLLGTVYLQETAKNSYYILDGQQRFISMYLFLKTLEYDNLPELTIGKNDQKFFDALISNHTDKLKPTTASQKRLHQALNKFRSKEEKDKKGLLCFTNEKVSVIKTIITDNKLAITTFITQTDRGKRLTNLEKLKSILYYYQLKICKHEEELEEIFGEIYNSLNILYEQPETSEADILRVLMVRLEQDQIYRSKDFKNLVEKEVRPDLSWEAGEDVIFDWINKVFSLSLLDIEKIQEALKRCIDIIKEINKALKFYVDYIEKNRQLKHILLSLNPSRFSRAWLVDYLNKGDPESLFTSRENIWAIDENNIPKMPDNVPPELNEYKKEIEDRIKRYKIELKEKNLLHLIEISELSCWKVYKRPISWFLNSNNTNLIPELVKFSKHHKEKYMLRDLGYGNYRYILMEYEAFWNSDLDITEFYSVMAEGNEVTKVHREHIFAQNPQEEIWNTIKTEGFGDNKSSYDNWIWNIGNIALLVESDNIKVSNKTPMDKAKEYEKQSKFKTTQQLGQDIEKYCKNDYKLIKTMLELREYELKMFILYRF